VKKGAKDCLKIFGQGISLLAGGGGGGGKSKKNGAKHRKRHESNNRQDLAEGDPASYSPERGRAPRLQTGFLGVDAPLMKRNSGKKRANPNRRPAIGGRVFYGGGA